MVMGHGTQHGMIDELDMVHLLFYGFVGCWPPEE